MSYISHPEEHCRAHIRSSPNPLIIPHLQLEPTTRGSSEKVGRSLRLTKERKAIEEAIEEFERVISESQVISAEELLIPVM
jgi:hypothetical protein